MPTVIRRLSLRIVELVVLLFAVLGFMFVPLGERTAFDHLRAVLGTPAAENAGRELSGAVARIGDKMRELVQQTTPSNDPEPAQLRVAPQSGLRQAPGVPPRDAGAPDVSLE